MTSLRAVASESERRAALFGSEVRILTAGRDPDAAALRALGAEAVLRHHQHVLSRFDPDSELSRLNAAVSETVRVSPTVLAFLTAARWALDRSEGLVDATVIDAVEASGYRESLARDRAASCSLREALFAAPDRRAAIPRQPSGWKAMELDLTGGTVTRPPGLRFDSGGVTKGHAADVAARGLADLDAYAVDCGGDIRLGGTAELARRIEITAPFDGAIATEFELASGAVATSGIDRRIWQMGDGFAHHVIDPGRGTPAWTGLVQATAVAPTALEAEVLAKAALLSGPSGARRWLDAFGGVAFTDSGELLWFGPLPQGRADMSVAA
jgi:thiamine biosynthesis lipoprotein